MKLDKETKENDIAETFNNLYSVLCKALEAVASAGF